MRFFPVFLFFLAFSLFSAETVDFRRPWKTGKWMNVQISADSETEFRFVIPGAADPVRRIRFARVFLLGSLRIDRCGTGGEPLHLTIRPVSAGGVVNGQSIEPGIFSGMEIHADLSGRKAVFRLADGKRLPEKAELLVDVLFQKVPFMKFSDLFGNTMKAGKKGDRKHVSAAPVLRQLKARNIELKDQKFNSGIVYEGPVKAGNIDCRRFRLEIETDHPENYDMRLRIKLALPADPCEENVFSMERRGVEVVSETLAVPDPMAFGAELRLITSESLSIVCLPLNPEKKKPSGNLLDRLFR